MDSNPSVSVAQAPVVVNGFCPVCGSPLRVQWAWLGGQGERLVIRCTMTQAPIDGNGERWCSFGAPLEGNEALFAAKVPA